MLLTPGTLRSDSGRKREPFWGGDCFLLNHQTKRQKRCGFDFPLSDMDADRRQRPPRNMDAQKPNLANSLAHEEQFGLRKVFQPENNTHTHTALPGRQVHLNKGEQLTTHLSQVEQPGDAKPLETSPLRRKWHGVVQNTLKTAFR